MSSAKTALPEREAHQGSAVAALTANAGRMLTPTIITRAADATRMTRLLLIGSPSCPDPGATAAADRLRRTDGDGLAGRQRSSRYGQWAAAGSGVSGKSWDLMGNVRRSPGREPGPGRRLRVGHAMIRFGRYQLDATQGLRRGGPRRSASRRSPSGCWQHLAERQGRVVTKDELFAAVWSDVAVTDSALATCIQEIRRALDDETAREPRYVETVHRRGYQFVARTSGDSEARTLAEVAVLARSDGPLIGRDADVAGRAVAASTWPGAGHAPGLLHHRRTGRWQERGVRRSASPGSRSRAPRRTWAMRRALRARRAIPAPARRAHAAVPWSSGDRTIERSSDSSDVATQLPGSSHHASRRASVRSSGPPRDRMIRESPTRSKRGRRRHPRPGDRRPPLERPVDARLALASLRGPIPRSSS